MGAKGDWDFWISDLVKTLMDLIFNSFGEFRCEVRRAQLAKSTLFNSMLWSLGYFYIFLGSVQMLKRQWGAEINGKLQHLFIRSKTVILVPEFAVENLPLDRTANLGACVCREKPALGQNTGDADLSYI